MAQSITAKGTNSSKADTTSLSVNNVTITGGRAIYVGVVFFAAAGNPDIQWGNKELRRDKTNEHATAGFRTQLYKAYVRTTRTLDVVCTWGTSTPGARAMVVMEVDEASLEDVSVVNDNNSSTTPNTSSAGDSTVANTLSIALFGSNGPIDDAQGTAGLGHTLDQRAGTTGGGATTNLTIQSTYEILTAIGVVRASLAVTTARDWANLIVAYKSSDTYTIEDAYYVPYDGNPSSEAVIFVIKDSSGVSKYQTHIPREQFQNMTDQEVTDRIMDEATWWANKVAGDAPSPDFQPDTAFNTRVSGFINDTFII